MIETLITFIGIAVFFAFALLFVVGLFRSFATLPEDDTKGDPTDHLGEV